MTEIRNLTDLAEYAQDQIERITRMQQEMADYVGEGTSPERLVKARTGPGGQLVDLRLEPDVLRLHPEEAAAEIAAAISTAQRDYADRTNAIMEPVLAARPSQHNADDFDEGIRRLDALTENLERLMSRRDLP